MMYENIMICLKVRYYKTEKECFTWFHGFDWSDFRKLDLRVLADLITHMIEHNVISTAQITIGIDKVAENDEE